MVEATQKNTATSKQADLPNLNFGIHVKNLSCSIHPTIVSNILDHYLRRPEDQQTVIGTLLGSVDGTKVDIQTSFACPISLSEDGKIITETEFTERMLKFHRKVNPKEGLIGFYKTGSIIDDSTSSIYYYYTRLLKDPKNKGLVNQPMLFLIDPTMKQNRLSIKILSLVNVPSVRSNVWTDSSEKEQKREEQVQIFAECPYRISMDEYHKTGLDLIFYGQEHYDTMAIVSGREQPRYDEIGQRMADQKLLSNKDLLARNFDEVIVNLDECDKFIQSVIDNGGEGDSDLGRVMDECLGQFSTDDMELLERLVTSNFEDALMISSLSKLQQHQLQISSQLNQIFADSIRTNTNFLTHKPSRKQQQETQGK